MILRRKSTQILATTALFGLMCGGCSEQTDIENLEKMELSTISVQNL